MAVEGAEDSGVDSSSGARVLGEEGLGLRVVGVGFGLVVGADVEETVEVAGGGRRVLSGLLGLREVHARGTCVLLAGLAPVETEVLEVVLAEVVAVVFCVVGGVKMYGTAVCLWVKAAGRKAQVD